MTNHYQTEIEIANSKEKVFRAISKNLGDWWGKQDQEINREGTIFKVSWGEPWYQFKVIKYAQDQEMIWECVDANQKISGLENVEKEWVGTKIHWELEEVEKEKTLLKFQHEGLVPEFICFNFCSQTWDHFLQKVLVNYLHE